MRYAFFMVIFMLFSFNIRANTLTVPGSYPTIQAAIDASANGDVVLVGPNVYMENISFKGKAIIVKSSHGPRVTTIDGGNPINPDFGSVVTFNQGEGHDSVLQGFTITNGKFTKDPVNPVLYGGGIYCKTASPTIRDNIIKDNKEFQTGCGAGIYCTGSSAHILNNTITGNKLLYSAGGGIFCVGSNVRIENNIITHNANGHSGGGVYCAGGLFLIRNNIIRNNGAADFGGGVALDFGSFNLINNNILNNSCIPSGEGGGVYNWGKNTVILNCIVRDNQAGGGGDELASYISASWDVRHCNIKGGMAGIGNIDADPKFADPGNHDYHLLYTSPCRNAGDSSHPHLPLFDYEGDPRSAGGQADIGADEFHTHLYFTGNAAPGGNIELKFIDSPTTSPVFLWLGSGVLNPPMHLPPHGDWHLQFPLLMQAQLGAIPGPDGLLSLPCAIPGALPPMNLPLQSGIGMKLTNLLELVIQ